MAASTAEGYEMIEYRDLETRQLYRPSTHRRSRHRRGDGPGPQGGLRDGRGRPGAARASRQLGDTVTLLDEGSWRRGNLSQFDAIMTGTRAYAVREDLKTYNHRLLDYVEGTAAT